MAPVAGSIAAICPIPVLIYIVPLATSGVPLSPVADRGGLVVVPMRLTISKSGDNHVHATASELKLSRVI